jgi:hypothetical protein
MRLSNKVSISLLILILLCLSALLYHNTITLFPAFIHSWTQSDRYAIALSFLNNGFDFFHPSTFNLQTINGVTRVDFPINDFMVALLMKVFGTTAPVVFRVYTLVCSIAGLSFLFLLSKKITASPIKAGMVVLFVFLSPIYVYYQAGFLPSVPAIAAVFAGYYYFFSYKENNSKKCLYLSLLFLTFAALMRMPFVVFLFATLLQQGWNTIKNKSFKRFEFFSFVLAFVFFLAYYFYNVHLGRVYGNMFLDYLMPPKSFAEFKEIISEMVHHWGLHYFTIWHYLLLLVCAVFVGVSLFKKRLITEENKKYWFHLLIIACGSTLYFLAMARQYYAHDYYFLDSFFIPVVFFLILSMCTIEFKTPIYNDVLGFSFLILIVLFFLNTKKIQAERYTSGPWDRTEITRQNFIGTEKYLDSTGVSKDAKILVIDAYSTNVPLILMNRKGYTVMGTTAKNISAFLFSCKWDYAAIQDVYLVSDVIKNYPLITALLQRVGGTGKVSFYKHSDKVQTKTLKQFLSITPENTFYTTNLSFDKTVIDSLHVKGRIKNVAEKYFSAPSAALLDSTIEYGTTLSIKANELKNQANLKVLINCAIFNNQKLDGLQLVAAITNPTETVFYQNFSISDYIKPSDKWQHLEFQFVLPEFKTTEDELKVYLWNPAKSVMYYDDLEMVVYK